MAFDEDIEREADDLETRVEQYVEDAERARSRIANIEQAIDSLRDDVELVKRLELKLEDANQDEQEASLTRDQLVQELETLEMRIEQEVTTLHSERDVLGALASMGEDVSESDSILDARETQLEACRAQLESLEEMLEVAVDSHVLSDVSVTTDTENPREGSTQAGEGYATTPSKDWTSRPSVSEYHTFVNLSLGSSHAEGVAINSPGMGYYAEITQDMIDEARQTSPDYEVTRGTFPLARTLEPMRHTANGGTLYDAPETKSRKLNWCQGLYSNSIQGDCGLCAVQNIARLGRKQLTERDIVELALKHNLCEKSPTVTPGERGGTDPESRRKLLSLIGIPSHLDSNQNIYHIADLVESGRGVIVPVEVRSFWHGSNIPFDQAGGHAVVITSVARDALGNPTWFHLCDSGLHDANYTVDADQFRESLRLGRQLNVTDRIIR